MNGSTTKLLYYLTSTYWSPGWVHLGPHACCRRAPPSSTAPAPGTASTSPRPVAGGRAGHRGAMTTTTTTRQEASRSPLPGEPPARATGRRRGKRTGGAAARRWVVFYSIELLPCKNRSSLQEVFVFRVPHKPQPAPMSEHQGNVSETTLGERAKEEGNVCDCVSSLASQSWVIFVRQGRSYQVQT